MHKKLTLFFFFGILPLYVQAQTINGRVYDADTGLPLPGATVKLIPSDPLIGAATDLEGLFEFKAPKVGRYSISASYVGYIPETKTELLILLDGNTFYEFYLKANTNEFETVYVEPDYIKERTASNDFVSISAYNLPVEEVSRYAGGFDDPARLASSFPGVAGTLQGNGLAIRGNAPKYQQWRLMGIEIPHPSHFADLNTFGAGGITALSTQMLGNSDFMTAAFPAEYGNVLSGVFDVRFRKGNETKHEKTFRAGLIGLDASAGGPMGNSSTYLFNYRYATLGLLAPLLPEDAGLISYSDLGWHMDGTIQSKLKWSFWGLGALNTSGTQAIDTPSEAEFWQDLEDTDIDQGMLAVGTELQFLSPFSTNSILSWQMAYTRQRTDLNTSRRIDAQDVLYRDGRLDFSRFINTVSWFNKINSQIRVKSGLSVQLLGYDQFLDDTPNQTSILTNVIDGSGNTHFYRAFSQSEIAINTNHSLKGGVHAFYYYLNGQFLVEPRLAYVFDNPSFGKMSIAYGLHSQIEPLNFYFSNPILNDEIQPNRKLGLTRAQHGAIAYSRTLSNGWMIRMELYAQYLFDVPVMPNRPESILSLDAQWFIEEGFENEGTAFNRGIEWSLEKGLSKGWYALWNLSLQRAEVVGGDGHTYRSLYDRSIISSLTTGYEWSNRNIIWNINLRAAVLSGNPITPPDEIKSLQQQDFIADNSRYLSDREPRTQQLDITINRTVSRKGRNETFSLQLLNALFEPQRYGYQFNLLQQRTEVVEEPLSIANISYKITF